MNPSAELGMAEDDLRTAQIALSSRPTESSSSKAR